MSTPSTWPARSAICLDCRTVLASPDHCPHGAHRGVSLLDARGRAALVTAVWGSALVGDRDPSPAAEDTGRDRASSWSAWHGFDVSGFDIALVLVLGVLLVVAVWKLGRFLMQQVDNRRHQLRARGAPRALPAPRVSGRIGTVVARDQRFEPLTGQPCVAFGVALSHRRQTMLRDGTTIGFDIALDSGERVQIPAGLVAIAATRAAQHVHDARIAEYLLALDPARRHRAHDDPFVYDDARLTLVRPGDRIELLSPVASIADPAGLPVAYREAAPSLLVPDGAVVLRPVA